MLVSCTLDCQLDRPAPPLPLLLSKDRHLSLLTVLATYSASLREVVAAVTAD